MNINIDFKVVAVSSNTNSFGLRQMIMISKCGKAYSAAFNYLNVKKQGEMITATASLNEETGKIFGVMFEGGELCREQPAPPQDVINDVFNS